MKVSLILFLTILYTSPITIHSKSFALETGDRVIEIFNNDDIHFFPDSSKKFNSDRVTSSDNGREINRNIQLPKYDSDVRITAHLRIYPIPNDEISVHDKWDRAGNIRLRKEGMADIEIVKFITAYGGYSEYSVDVSHLKPVLFGECAIVGFIDTWVTPAWKVDFSLEYEIINDSTGEEVYIDYIFNPDWVEGIMFVDSYNAKDMGNDGVEFDVVIPDSLKRINMYYYVSGHCTDGSGADEFVPKDNVIYVDGVVVYRFQPWRDDCRKFREYNPYTRRWSDGYWSSDYSRSGWCPGDKVDPIQIDLSDHLTPGKHKITFVIENVRPSDENDHFGYWRISSHLIGWEEKVNTVKW